MVGKSLSFVLSVVFIFLMNCPAWSSVEGNWEIDGKTTVKVKINKFWSERETIYFSDEIVFRADSTFDSLELEGVWSQDGRKFTVSMDSGELDDTFEDILEEILDTDVDVEVTSFTYSGSENRASEKIKGKMRALMDVYVPAYGFSGTAQVNSIFKGYRPTIE